MIRMMSSWCHYEARKWRHMRKWHCLEPIRLFRWTNHLFYDIMNLFYCNRKVFEWSKKWKTIVRRLQSFICEEFNEIFTDTELKTNIHPFGRLYKPRLNPGKRVGLELLRCFPRVGRLSRRAISFFAKWHQTKPLRCFHPHYLEVMWSDISKLHTAAHR